MTFPLRLFVVAALLIGYFTTAQAQITITSVTPNPICAGASITITYSSLQSGTLSAYLYSTNSTDYGSPKPIQTIPAGNNLSITVPIASTQAPGSYTIRFTNNTPSSTTYTTISSVTVNAAPPAPTTNNITLYCQGSFASPLSATANPGGTLNWYGTSASGGTASSSPTIPFTTIAGTTNYYVSQTINGCEGPRTAINVAIRPLPTAPSANSLTYCQGVTAPPLTATTSSGGTLFWYNTVAEASTVAPIPPTSQVGIMTYYVSQSVNLCEGPRIAIKVTVNPNPIVSIDAEETIITPSHTSLTLTATASVSALIWSTGETTPSIVINTDGVYSVTVTAPINCFAVASATIAQSALEVIYSVKTGEWSDPTVWSTNQLPTNLDAVRLRHIVNIPASCQAKAGLLSYDAGGQLQTDIGSQLLVSPYD